MAPSARGRALTEAERAAVLCELHSGLRERRDQLAQPPYAAPELLAQRPNEVWSWDRSGAIS